MDVADILFKLYLPYNRTTYGPLKDLAANSYYDRDRKLYAWIFELKDVNTVSGIVGTPIQFSDDDIRELALRAPSTAKVASNPAYKGVGDFQVIVFPKIVLIKTIVNKERKTFKLPIELVQNVWNAVAKNPVGKPIKTRTIAEHWCALQGYTRYHRQTGTFDFQKFFGDRPTYLRLNLSLVALRHFGAIAYERSGHVTKLHNSFELQSTIKTTPTIL